MGILIFIAGIAVGTFFGDKIRPVFVAGYNWVKRIASRK